MKKVVFPLFLLFLFSLTIAQPPQKMSYQAVVRNVNNELIVNQQIGIKISIIRTAPGSVAVYEETHQVTTNSNGLFSIQVGAGTPAPGTDFSTIGWGNDNYYLKSEIDISGGQNYSIVGTEQLITVPYAFYAAGGNYRNLDNRPPDGNREGDLLYWSSADTSWHIVPVGNVGQVLTLGSGGVPQWQNSSGGGQAGTPPTIVTDSIINIAAKTANVHATIMAGGSSNIIASGICWGSSPYPSISNNPTTDGSTSGSYISSMIGLTPGVLYYARAYATNSAGTSYGDPISFTTPNHCGTVSDYEGNVYQTIYIGNQCWMKENLRSTKYTTGTIIYQGVSSSTSYPYYPNKRYYVYGEDSTNIEKFGLLYTYSAAINDGTPNNNIPSGIQGLCPLGWHLPSLKEWCELENCLEPGVNVFCNATGDLGSFAQALSLPQYWNSHQNQPLSPGYWHFDSTNFNTSQFSAVPAGRYRYYKSGGTTSYGYNSINQYTYWWTATEESSYKIFVISMGFTKPGINIDVFDWKFAEAINTYACSIRCVKN